MKTEKAIEMYAEMMVKTIENLQSGWTKTWFSAVSKAPRNAEGREYNGMNKILLRMLMACEGWTCPVFVTYNKAKSMGVNVKRGELYTDLDKTRAGQEYYSTAIHEMAHSTGHKSRLDRFGENRKSYGHEELVAELTTAFVCNELGFLSEVQENSAAYLKGWLGNIKSNPKYLVTLVADVNKAANMILDKINK